MKRIEQIITETNEKYQIEFAGRTHEVEKITDTSHLITACGISTWSDLHELMQNEKLTCKRCVGARQVTIDAVNFTISSGDELLHQAPSFSDARLWCYEHGALGISMVNGKVTSTVFLI